MLSALPSLCRMREQQQQQQKQQQQQQLPAVRWRSALPRACLCAAAARARRIRAAGSRLGPLHLRQALRRVRIIVDTLLGARLPLLPAGRQRWLLDSRRLGTCRLGTAILPTSRWAILPDRDRLLEWHPLEVHCEEWSNRNSRGIEEVLLAFVVEAVNQESAIVGFHHNADSGMYSGSILVDGGQAGALLVIAQDVASRGLS